MKMESSWRFDTPGPMPSEAVREFDTLIGKVVAQGNRWRMLEHFKGYFGASGSSSSESWAESDLNSFMSQTAENAPLFIEAFYEGCEALRGDDGIAVPDVGRMNRILKEHGVGYEIRPPELVAVGFHEPISVPERYQSLDEQAQDIVQQSLQQSEKLLAEGHPRQAVQEILWLMESVVTAFKGLSAGNSTIEEKYFNKIAQELRAKKKGQTIEQVLTWLTTLHGYLSSPTGGGVRHGVDLKSGITINADEGRLYCNLIRSYVTFLMAEHYRMSRGT
ncbi:hypothetical protein CK226_20785 [Mesorhizobium sp. WSM4311]|uniref:hypothetical protein n=2 Tax=unclassified Mesorhizobium TaxID=325217 RepID=UPI000BB08BD9|nr:hypothetical protein [Mesorhizobium sp. WSM4305]PBC21272.1 hypothetical protein CK226_20785 [Mesorhizobium sp. WSM4311]TRD04799.1 hypothetical protein FJV82_13155 [Mesorhizobium sp. WSM4305]